MENIIKEIETYLFANQDKKYLKFNASLIPSRDISFFIGVRIPIVKKYAKDMKNHKDINIFLSSLPHTYYEENILHRAILEYEKDYDKLITSLSKLLPYLNSWGETDGFRNKVIEKNKDKYIAKLQEWLKNSHVYTVRFAIYQMMTYYLDEDYKSEYLDIVYKTKINNEYYLEMMVALYFATALAKQFNTTIEYISTHEFEPSVSKKILSKCRDSFRISEDQFNKIKIALHN